LITLTILGEEYKTCSSSLYFQILVFIIINIAIIVIIDIYKLRNYPKQQTTTEVKSAGSRTRKFNTANTKAPHWTRCQARSIHLQPSQPISLRFILMLSSRLSIL
jgi:septal ring-binding cell division protein DamX